MSVSVPIGRYRALSDHETRDSMTASINEGKLSAQEQLYTKALEYERFEGHKPLALIHSFGCQQNVSDGEKLKGMLSAIGFAFTDKTEEA